MANFTTNYGTDMRSLSVRGVDTAELEGDLGVNTENQLTFGPGEGDDGYSFNYYGNFEYAFDFDTSELLYFSGNVNSLSYNWYYHDYDVTPEEYYEGRFDIDGFSLDINLFQYGYTNAQLVELIFSGDDRIKGSLENDYLVGYAGADTLWGNEGKDTLDGGTGQDVLLGGAGNDLYIIDNVRDVVWEYENEGNDTVQSAVSYRIGLNIENLALTGKSNTDATGNELANRLVGNTGNNTLVGGAGADFLSGGAGADKLDGGSETDIASYSSASASVTANLTNAAANTGDAKGDTYVSIESLIGSNYADKLYGNAVGNAIYGENDADTIYGYAGNDRLLGGNGNDALIGGAGADVLNGGDGTDRVYYTTGVTVSLLTPSVNTGEAKGDSFISIENLTGSDFSDSIFGNAVANSIAAGAGNDIINGYGGRDVLAGGAGNDTFVFDTGLNATTNVDTITDYNVAADTIRLENAIFTTLTATGVLTSTAFVKNAAGVALDASDRIIYETDTGKLFYDRDGSGSGFAGIQFAKLTAGLAVTNADFFIV